MKSKKLIAIGLAGVMTLAMAAPTFAADTVITGMYDEIEIAVEIPETGTAVINPYEMPVQAMSGTKKMGALTTAGKIATQPLVGISTCEVALDVGATVTGTPKGDLMLTNKDISSLKTKSAVIYLECKQDKTLVTADAAASATDPISGVTGANAVTAFNGWEKSTYNFGTDDAAKKANSDKVLVTEAGSTKLGLCTIAPAKDTVDDTGAAGTDGVLDPQIGSFFLARLSGDVVQSPTDAWTAKDGVVVNVAFTFTPAAPKEGGAITLTEASITAGPTAKVVAPDGVTFAADATYKWEIVDAGDSGVEKITGATATGTLTTTGTMADNKPFTIRCTVTSDGIKYISEAELTLAA